MTAVLSTTLFADPVTQVDAADLHIVAATDAADATARSVSQVTTVAGLTYGENDAIAVATEVVVDGRTLEAGLWYWPVATVSADVNALVRLNPVITDDVTVDAPTHGLNAATLAGQGLTRGVYDAGTVRLATTAEDHDVLLLGVVDANTLSVALPNHAYQFPALAPILDTLGVQTLLYRSNTTDGAWTQSPATGDPIARYLGNGWVQMLEAGGAAASAKNALVYPVGNFTALAVNDSGAGADGGVYKLPTVDALQMTLPNKADMNAAEGIWRARISGDWAALSTQATVLSFIDDTANGVDMGTGLPDAGNEWLDLVFNAAGDEWIATSGGDVTLTQVIPTYTLHTEVPANIRLYLIDGTAASAEGLYRKETVGDAPNHIG